MAKSPRGKRELSDLAYPGTIFVALVSTALLLYGIVSGQWLPFTGWVPVVVIALGAVVGVKTVRNGRAQSE